MASTHQESFRSPISIHFPSLSIFEDMADESQWTLDTLREHLQALADARHDQLDRRFVSFEKRFDDHVHEVQHEASLSLQYTQEAIQKSEAAAERRFEAISDFHGRLSEQMREFLPRPEIETRFSELYNFRDRLASAQQSLLSRHEYQTAHQALIDRLDAVQSTLNSRITTMSDTSTEAHTQLDRRNSLNGTAIEKINAQRAGSNTTLTVLLTIVGLLASLTIVGLSIYAATKR